MIISFKKNNEVKVEPEHGIIYLALFQILDQKVTISIKDLLEIVRYETSPKEALRLFYQVIFIFKAYRIAGGARKMEDDLSYVIANIKR
ncbi:MAG: hypothetical protein IPO48_07320 [Saprospiraceae bacterium]|nr:hypothetical protein [Saprospiraceae bacterium]